MKTDFPALAEHTSERERVAEDAERDLTRYYHATWAKEHRGEIFSGVITGCDEFWAVRGDAPTGWRGCCTFRNSRTTTTCTSKTP